MQASVPKPVFDLRATPLQPGNNSSPKRVIAANKMAHDLPLTTIIARSDAARGSFFCRIFRTGLLEVFKVAEKTCALDTLKDTTEVDLIKYTLDAAGKNGADNEAAGKESADNVADQKPADKLDAYKSLLRVLGFNGASNAIQENLGPLAALEFQATVAVQTNDSGCLEIAAGLARNLDQGHGDKLPVLERVKALDIGLQLLLFKGEAPLRMAHNRSDKAELLIEAAKGAEKDVAANYYNMAAAAYDEEAAYSSKLKTDTGDARATRASEKAVEAGQLAAKLTSEIETDKKTAQSLALLQSENNGDWPAGLAELREFLGADKALEFMNAKLGLEKTLELLRAAPENDAVSSAQAKDVFQLICTNFKQAVGSNLKTLAQLLSPLRKSGNFNAGDRSAFMVALKLARDLLSNPELSEHQFHTVMNSLQGVEGRRETVGSTTYTVKPDVYGPAARNLVDMTKALKDLLGEANCAILLARADVLEPGIVSRMQTSQ